VLEKKEVLVNWSIWTFIFLLASLKIKKLSFIMHNQLKISFIISLISERSLLMRVSWLLASF
jgi:succinate-acetate transporter protein